MTAGDLAGGCYKRAPGFKGKSAEWCCRNPQRVVSVVESCVRIVADVWFWDGLVGGVGVGSSVGVLGIRARTLA